MQQTRGEMSHFKDFYTFGACACWAQIQRQTAWTKRFHISKEESKTQMKGSQGAEVPNSSFRGFLKLVERCSAGNNNSEHPYIKGSAAAFQFRWIQSNPLAVQSVCDFQHNRRAAGFLSPDVVSSVMRAEAASVSWKDLKSVNSSGSEAADSIPLHDAASLFG